MAGECDAVAKGNGWVIDWCRKAAEDQGSQLASPGSTGMHHLTHLKAHLSLHTPAPCLQGTSMKGTEGSRGDRAGQDLQVQHVIICEAQILDASPAEGPASFPVQTQQLPQRAATALCCKAVASALPNEHRSSSISLGLQLWPP